MKKWILGCGEG
jgi:uncharacterized protein (DUF924 family)